MAKRLILLVLLGTFLFAAACAQAKEQTSGTPDVATLLSDPQYEDEVGVFGLVGDLGTMFCPCFTLSSGGESLTVWYDSMVMPDGSQLPAVSVEGFGNGEIVTVAGWLQKGRGTQPKTNFYATKIVRGTTGEGCDTAVEATPCVEK